jgi:hypothetical protein
MANRLTRVPDRPVPPLPSWLRPAVAVADAFMLAMISRPATGSLSRTWVTPATLQMCIATAALALAGAVALAITGLVAPAAVLLLLAAGAGAVALVGAVQRRQPAGG